MEIMKFITENALQLVPVYWIIGYMIKKTELVKDKFIPIILLICSLGFTPTVLNGFTDPESYLQAVLVVGAAVLFNEIPKQIKKVE